MKLTQQDKARLLGIDARTLRNWRKEKTYLYEIIEKGFAFEEFVKTAQEKIDDLIKLEDRFRASIVNLPSDTSTADISLIPVTPSIHSV